jgi:hypothetical protein
MPRTTLRGDIVAGVMSIKWLARRIYSFRPTRCACLWEARKRIRKIFADDIVRFLTHFNVSRAIKDYVMEAGPLGRPQRPRHAKRRRESDHNAVQVAVEGKILCCGAKQNYHYVEVMDSPRDYDEKLAVYGQGLCGAPTLACHVLCRQRK